jgi:TonB family protein
MPPTLKDSLAVANSSENVERVAGPSSSEGSSVQPVALEVPITINGARAVEGSSKREPFSESTSTVLVLANGAVIRLASSVAPGQLLFLTNEKTKKEVVCQVVKSKNARSASGYVELEFTEPVLGFWGMRFPGERTGQGNASLSTQPKAQPAAPPTRAISAAPGNSGTESQQSHSAPVAKIVAKPIEEIEEFKTEIKADLRPSSRAEFLAPSDPTIDGLKVEANRLQEQLSALLFAEQKASDSQPVISVEPLSKQEVGNAAAKIFEMAKDEPVAKNIEAIPVKQELSDSAQTIANNKNAASASSFENDELKVPAWLEPLARNATISAPAVEEVSMASDRLEEEHASVALETASASKRSPATAPDIVKSGSKRASTAAVFGNSLLGEIPAEVTEPKGSGKGIWIAVAACVLLAAGAGAWYFRDSLQSASSEHSATASSAAAISTPRAVAPQTSSAALPTPPAETYVSAPRSNSSNSPAETTSSNSSAGQGKVQAASITERVPKSASSNNSVKPDGNVTEVIEPEIKKPSLGAVRLAKPKVHHTNNAQANGEIEPSLELGAESITGGDSSLGAGFAETSNQPAAPAVIMPVGGDVKPARMISSVPPVYPALARSQHIAGDVKIDALVDVNGRVTTMKVVSGPSLLYQAAKDSLRQWKYQAASLDGKAVPMHLTVTIQFRMQ